MLLAVPDPYRKGELHTVYMYTSSYSLVVTLCNRVTLTTYFNTILSLVLIYFTSRAISMCALCVSIYNWLHFSLVSSGIPIPPLPSAAKLYSSYPRHRSQTSSLLDFWIPKNHFWTDRISVRWKLSPLPHQCPSMSLTGTACSCQAAISLLIGVLAATLVPTPTLFSSHPPLHNTNKPTSPPQLPEKICAYFRLSGR